MSVLIRQSHAANDTPLWEASGTSGNSILPAGMMMLFGGTSAPQGWLFADGSPVSRTTYADLFAVIGTTFGNGDGLTTFNLPNTSGKVVRGVGLAPFTLGAIGGADNTTLIADNLPAHLHAITDPGHSHTSTGQGTGYSSADGGNGNRADIGTTGISSTGITATDNNVTLNTPVSLVNTFVAINYIIKWTNANV